TPSDSSTIGEVFSANCDSDDLLIGGDCIQKKSGFLGELVHGDAKLSILGNPNCSGCPNDAANCDSQCFNNEYNSYNCFYFNKNIINFIQPDGTSISLNEPTGIINISPGSKIQVVRKTYEELGGTPSRGARAICLDR